MDSLTYLVIGLRGKGEKGRVARVVVELNYRQPVEMSCLREHVVPSDTSQIDLQDIAPKKVPECTCFEDTCGLPSLGLSGLLDGAVARAGMK